MTSTKAPETLEVEDSEINQNTSKNENIRWSLQFLADLEFSPVPHPRFSTFEQIVNLVSELEQRQKNCYDELLKKCPDYFKRIILAIDTVSKCFDSSHLEQNLASTFKNNS